jgi:hypothetical protein
MQPLSGNPDVTVALPSFSSTTFITKRSAGSAERFRLPGDKVPGGTKVRLNCAWLLRLHVRWRRGGCTRLHRLHAWFNVLQLLLMQMFARLPLAVPARLRFRHSSNMEGLCA